MIVTLPIDRFVFMHNPDASDFATLTKFIRIVKIVRLVRLIKLVKVAKDRKKISRILSSQVKMHYAVERLVLSLFGFFLLCHVIACMWILQAKLQENPLETTWVREADLEYAGPWETYIAAYYFSVTTFTTVGYGDISATGLVEQILSIFLMFGGVFAYSFATGTLTAIISNLDVTNKQVNEKMQIVHDLCERFDLETEVKQ